MVLPFRLTRIASATAMTAILLGAAVCSPTANAQSYTCFPTCTQNDGRMLALASAGSNDAFAGNEITIGIGLPPNADTLELGFFDGETGNHWDIGSTQLEYRLYADPNGDGSNLGSPVATYNGSSMTNNAWYSEKVAVDTSAEATSGNFIYLLRVTMPTGTTSTSAFKLRSNGTITVKAHQSFSISAPLTKNRDAAVIYPDYDSTDVNTRNDPDNYILKNYDGTWNIYLEVPQPSSSLKIWDGDMDHGSYDASTSDEDDANTPATKPSWATANAVDEGARGAAPFDDNAAIYNRHSPSVRYDVIFPDGSTSFANNNPSGNLEWELFRIDTDTTDLAITDANTTSIPAGIYNVRVEGMDMLNVNAWRFFNDVQGVVTDDVEVIGVNAAGIPQAPIKAEETVNGSVSGVVFYDSDEDGVQDAGEPGIPSVTVLLHEVVNGVVVSTTSLSNIDGNYTFGGIGGGTYDIEVDSNSLHSDVVATYDADGTTTENVAEVVVSANQSNIIASFGYKRGINVGTGTRGYWTNHPDDWPVESITLGGVSYTKAQAITILKRPTKGDKAYSMAAQLIATKLNLLSGSNSTCIASDVVDGDDWLADHPLNGGRTSDTAWSTGSTTHQNLDDYNNGRLCAPHMD